MRNSRRNTKESLAGSLLLAHPVLRDSNFRRTIVLMSAHDQGGAMGVVLNRPLGKKLGDMKGDFMLGPLASAPVFSGGPVEPNRMILAAWQCHPDGFQLHFGIDPSRAVQLMDEEGTHVRAFLGYSGWSAGQLEKELGHSAWIIADAPADLLEQPPDEELWRSVLGREGAEWRLLADEPDDLDLN